MLYSSLRQDANPFNPEEGASPFFQTTPPTPPFELSPSVRLLRTYLIDSVLFLGKAHLQGSLRGGNELIVYWQVEW